MRVRAGQVLGRIPAAQVLLPLAAGATVSLTVPGGGQLGPFSAGLREGGVSFIALLLVCIGAQITPGSLRPVASRIAVILVCGTVITGLGAIAYGRWFGDRGVGGVSVMAVSAAAVCSSNALWMALASRHGSEGDQWGGAVAAVINSSPVVPMLVLAAASDHHSGALPVAALVDAVVPLAIGFAAGLIVPDCRHALKAGVPVLVVALSFALGCQLNLRRAAGDLPAGLCLGVAAAALSGGLVAAGWRILLGEPATVGWAAAGSPVSMPLIPGIVASAVPAWTPFVGAAAGQLTAALIASSLAAPALTSTCARWRRGRLARHATSRPASPMPVPRHPRCGSGEPRGPPDQNVA